MSNSQLQAAQTAYEKTLLPNFHEGDDCPIHGTKHKKIYTFGSSMSAETDVCVFQGCRCAVAILHSPIGNPSLARGCQDYNEAAGLGKLRAMEAKAKYR